MTKLFALIFLISSTVYAKETIWLSGENHDVLVILSKVESVEKSDGQLCIRVHGKEFIIHPADDEPGFKGMDMVKIYFLAINQLISFPGEVTDARTNAAFDVFKNVDGDIKNREMVAPDVGAGQGIFYCKTIQVVDKIN